MENICAFTIFLQDSGELFPLPFTESKYGLSEEIIGEWLKHYDRSNIVISSKVRNALQLPLNFFMDDVIDLWQ